MLVNEICQCVNFTNRCASFNYIYILPMTLELFSKFLCSDFPNLVYANA